jgi:parallel beta-helix repeat protein
MKAFSIFLTSLFTVLFVAEVSLAATYYVSTNGKDSNPGTDAAPWRTVSKAAQMLQPGDTIYIKGGTYAEQVIPARSGLAGSEITYAAYPGEIPVLDGQTLSITDPDWGGLFLIKDKSYIRVLGLRIQNSASISGSPGIAGILVTNSNNILLENNTIFNTRSSGIGIWDSTYVRAFSNDIQKAVNGGSQECLTVSNSSFFEVARNHVHNGSGLEVGGEGIDVKQASVSGTVHHNFVYALPGAVGLYIDAYSSVAPGLQQIKVYNNSISNVSIGIAIGAESGGNVQDIQVFNNVVHHTGSQGILVTDWMGGSEGTKKNIAIFNNTAVANGSGTWGGGITIASSRVENISVYNNILSDNVAWQLRVNTAAESQISATHNLIYGPNEYVEGSLRSITGTYAVVGNNPLLVSATDFHLQPNSPALDGGCSSGAPAFDLDDTFRPQGSGYDIGAYEYVSADKSPPSSPTGVRIIN